MGTDDKPDPKQDDDAWIERVVDIAGNLGFNKMRLRWKLIRWQDRRRRSARRREQVVAHITYAHKTCHDCGAVQDKDEALCTRCGAKLGARGFQVLERIGLAMPVPRSMSTLLAIAILVAYARVWVAGGGGLSSPSGQLLVAFGGRWALLMSDEPWRLVTSMFLHAGLLHLVFNLLALATVGPRVEELYGRATMLGLFLVTGVLANLATLQVAPGGVGIGASGGVMGLIGAAAGCGHRAGTGRGRALRDAMLKWIAYTFLFGFFVGADNWAHLFGAATGAAFGLLVRPEVWTRRALILVRAAIGVVGLVATVGAVAIICTRTPPTPSSTTEGAAFTPLGVVDGYVDACIRFYAGDVPGAIAVAERSMAAIAEDHEAIDERFVDDLCDAMQRAREACKLGGATLELAPGQRELCTAHLPALDRLPVPPARREPAAGSAAGSAR